MKQTIVRIQKSEKKDDNIFNVMKKKMPNEYTRYFAPTENVAPVSLMRLSKHDLKKSTTQSKFVNVTRATVGKHTLFQHIQLHSKVLPNRTNEIVEDFYEHIVFGLGKLVNAHIVHFSLQPNNILYSDSQYCPILTEFGQGFVLEELNNDERMESIFSSSSETTGRCLESKCISTILRDPDWKKKQVNINDMETTVSQHFSHKEEEATKKWQKYISTFRGKSGKEAIHELMENWDTWDLYAVNTLFENYLQSNTMYEPGKPYTKMDKNLFVTI